MSAVPKDAAAIILLRSNTNPNNPEVFLVRRSMKLAFLGGYYAFPGGRLTRQMLKSRYKILLTPKPQPPLAVLRASCLKKLRSCWHAVATL